MNFVKKYGLTLASLFILLIWSVFLYKNLVGRYLSPEEKLGATLGKALVYGLIVFLATGFLRKRWGRKRFEFYMACFANTFLLCTFVEIVKAHRHTDHAQQELVRLASRESETSHDDPAKEDFAQILQIAKSSYEGVEKIILEINGACIPLQDIYSPAQLCNREYILHAKKLVAHFIDVIHRCEKKYYEEIALTEARFHKALPRQDAFTRGFFKGFEESKRKASTLFSHYFQAERDFMQSTDHLLSFLFEKLGCFSVEEETFFFEKDEDAALYDDLVEKLIQHSENEAFVIQELEAYQQSTRQNITQ